VGSHTIFSPSNNYFPYWISPIITELQSDRKKKLDEKRLRFHLFYATEK
jgi:hypothetical protein